jgi:SAM-dependent methyltransferase
MTLRPDQIVQQNSFNQLVKQGVYGQDFHHAVPLRQFFSRIMTACLNKVLPIQETITLLDCGCGNGYWITETQQIMKEYQGSVHYYGFDLSDNMLDVARQKTDASTVTCYAGDLLDQHAYFPSAVTSGFHIIYAFDALQQLPPKRQYECCELMLKNLHDQGFLILFDHDADSHYGRSMARKKWLTRYFYLPLVPRYYCNAHYPPLMRFAEQLSRIDQLNTYLVFSHLCPKIALIASRSTWE